MAKPKGAGRVGGGYRAATTTEKMAKMGKLSPAGLKAAPNKKGGGGGGRK